MKYLLFAFILSFSLVSRSAQIEEFDKNFYVLKGLIEKGDSDKLLDKIKNTKHAGLLLDSKGGDLEEAIKIGSIVKTLGMTVNVSKEGICGSACFFIYMNGLSRLAAGIELKGYSKASAVGFIAIHRPFFKEADTNTNSNQKVLQKRAAEYLKELSVPTDLIEKMMSVSSVDAYFLTNDDIDRLGARPSEIEELYISKCKFNSKDTENVNICTVQIDSDIFVEGYTRIINGWKPRGYLDSSWNKLAKFDNGNIYVDYNSIVKNGKLIKVWLLVDYMEALASPDEGKFHTQSSVEYVEFDCKKPSFRGIADEWYSDNMCGGSLIGSFGSSKWWRLKDGGQRMVIAHKNLCKFK